ncbi:hypothetical protein KXD93_13990 [Mucilaginibacter sp. BJC16-A38]|uniref:hypothetical protein n=1 Tax=Mucilaginibacter phenanthrenivorans TaxID=1234842 RepID=UPI0021576157|nr:hypothetical protein [Mucilaginibacter phenanthrenivorans]MCR8558764.1 hypothetical protein [Mucilaginibacter phenanthrenivorans]
MKKLVFACILVSGAYSLQAQTQQLKPKDFSNPMEKYFTPPTESKPDGNNLLKPKLDLDKAWTLTSNMVKLDGQPFFSKMPIMKLDGFDNMPIAKLDGYDNMPILGFGADKAKKLKQAQSY